ncbi:hypothetical protein BC628DRAFT_796395 [Trametes gibbosa]|nr:hypothetical protein BC628DRAFT_796395 [Trametes gibbosa]
MLLPLHVRAFVVVFAAACGLKSRSRPRRSTEDDAVTNATAEMTANLARPRNRHTTLGVQTELALLVMHETSTKAEARDDKTSCPIARHDGAPCAVSRPRHHTHACEDPRRALPNDRDTAHEHSSTRSQMGAIRSQRRTWACKAASVRFAKRHTQLHTVKL